MKIFLGLLILAGVVYVGAKVVPIYFANFELQDTMKLEARSSLARRSSPEEVRRNVAKKAQELELPLRPEDIRVDVSPGYVNVRANYSVTVDLYVYQLKLELHPESGQL